VKLEILILTQPKRAKFLNQLMSILSPQLDGKSVQIQICDDRDGNIGTLGDKREYMRRCATAEYICFVDDDDFVSPHYVERILPLLDGVDQIGFDLIYFEKGMPIKPAHHSLKYETWASDNTAFYRDISHLNPMRRELALEVPMSGTFGEDMRWSQAMRGKVKTEHYIPEELYFYLFRQFKKDATDHVEPRRLKLLEILRSGSPP
jgi:hypothetical protein